MSIEPQLDLDLDRLSKDELPRRMATLEEKKQSLVTLGASAHQRDAIRETLLALRASGASSLLVLRRPPEPMDSLATVDFLAFLRDWDQLLLRNILEVGVDRVPAKYSAALELEARTEVKWFQEWQTAVSDPRIHRYPGLPWRSFLRKVNAENFTFAEHLLLGSPDLERRIELFLAGKKKTICVFPKNWGKR